MQALTTSKKEPSYAKDSRDFWTKLGMDSFVSWMTDPHNHERLNKKSPVSSQRVVGLYQEIAKFINEKHGTDWDREKVKHKIIYSKKKYDAAKKLSRQARRGETKGLNDLRKQMLAICPHYDKFDVIWGDTVAKNSSLKDSPSSKDGEHSNQELSPELIGPIDDDHDNYISDSDAQSE
ncbi:hypothetical protein BGX20_008440 [Mortierella sp. AD010]|nr:hypothetical protein BGX20_008440 [Mortierella sp. AD010]